MAMVSTEDVSAQVRAFGALPALKQVGLMIGLALSVALGVTVALWSQSPNYSMLFAGLATKDLSDVTRTLDASGIRYEIDRGTGAILVPAEKVHDARITLAAQGLPRGNDVGFELLEKEQGFGSSSFLQKARYQRALEGELAQSISKLNVVESARVHLAIPKQTAFARKTRSPAVSVVLHLYPGRRLDEMQVAGIINMVASSVPELEAEHVTVIDQKGRLLSRNASSSEMLLTSTQFDYTQRLEQRYVKRIVDIISPITGLDGVRAQVVADLDFTSQEQTRESFQPDQRVVRSEQIMEENSDRQTAMGIPGALSNQPPPAARLDTDTPDETPVTPSRSSTKAVRNYEIDRTISHTRQSPVSLRRLSVAVIVDYHSSVDSKGKLKREPLNAEELKRIKSLVREAVGLNEARGDTISIVNTPFQQPETVEPLPEAQLWEQPWVMSAVKQVLGAIVVLLIAFGILRPMLKNLSTHGHQAAQSALVNDSSGEGQAPGADQLALGGQVAANGPKLLEMASSLAKDDPKRVAQVLNSWVVSNE